MNLSILTEKILVNGSAALVFGKRRGLHIEGFKPFSQSLLKGGRVELSVFRILLGVLLLLSLPVNLLLDFCVGFVTVVSLESNPLDLA